LTKKDSAAGERARIAVEKAPNWANALLANKKNEDRKRLVADWRNAILEWAGGKRTNPQALMEVEERRLGLKR
jgi:hypothetical protein